APPRPHQRRGARRRRRGEDRESCRWILPPSRPLYRSHQRATPPQPLPIRQPVGPLASWPCHFSMNSFFRSRPVYPSSHALCLTISYTLVRIVSSPEAATTLAFCVGMDK